MANFNEYMTCLQKAADAGVPLAMEAPSYEKAARAFSVPATHNHPDSLFQLGLLCEEGRGVEKDAELAMRCFNQAAQLGHQKASEHIHTTTKDNEK